MERLQFSTSIQAPPARVWFALWNDQLYRRWTKAFSENSYAVSDWQPGSRVHFLDGKGRGMYSRIAEMVPDEKMVFEHIGDIFNNEEQPPTGNWTGATEGYALMPTDTGTQLDVWVDTETNWADMFNQTFPKAMALLKALCEDFRIVVTTTVAAPAQTVWDCWTLPEHITQWNFASPDWCCPRAQNDLRPGGKLISRMEARDGSMGFDFEAVYSVVVPPQQIDMELGDGRKVSVSFSENDGKTVVTESFEPENIHSLDLQYAGWNAILQNFKAYTEGLT